MTYAECPWYDCYELCDGCPERIACNEYRDYVDNGVCEFEHREYGEEGYPDMEEDD